LLLGFGVPILSGLSRKGRRRMERVSGHQKIRVSGDNRTGGRNANKNLGPTACAVIRGKYGSRIKAFWFIGPG